MAKGKRGVNNPNEELDELEMEALKSPEVESNEEHIEDAEEEVAVAVIEQQTKHVSITALEDIDCWVGGVHYFIRDKKKASVPADVAAILSTSRKAYRN